MTYLWSRDISQTRRAWDMQSHAYEERTRRIGREHVYTLWTACNLARIAIARGYLEKDEDMIQKAKEILQDGLDVAHRNLGEKHIGTLTGRSHLANAMVFEKDYERAEEAFREVSEMQRSSLGARNGTQRDRLMTLLMWQNCYELQGQYRDALGICDLIVEEQRAFGIKDDHEWAIQTVRRNEELRMIVREGTCPTGEPPQLLFDELGGVKISSA